jgi:hypothetical protein
MCRRGSSDENEVQRCNLGRQVERSDECWEEKKRRGAGDVKL